MFSTARSRLIAALGVAIAAIGVVVLVVPLLRAPSGLTPEQFSKLVSSGTLGGIPVTYNEAPAKPVIKADDELAAYPASTACRNYWNNASEKLLIKGEASPTDPTTSWATGAGSELWVDAAAATSAVTDWWACVADIQKADPSNSHPLKVVSQGTTGGTAWLYAENSDLDFPVRVLALRHRNVVLTLDLPDGPPADWRDQVATAFASEVTKAGA